MLEFMSSPLVDVCNDWEDLFDCCKSSVKFMDVKLSSFWRTSFNSSMVYSAFLVEILVLHNGQVLFLFPHEYKHDLPNMCGQLVKITGSCVYEDTVSSLAELLTDSMSFVLIFS